MSDIRIRRPHALPRAKARREAQKIADQLKEKFDLEYEWDGDVVNFHRQGVTGHLRVGEDEIHLEAKLGFLLAFLKPTIEGHINENLDRVFGKEGERVAAAKPATTRTDKARK